MDVGLGLHVLSRDLPVDRIAPKGFELLALVFKFDYKVDPLQLDKKELACTGPLFECLGRVADRLPVDLPFLDRKKMHVFVHDDQRVLLRDPVDEPLDGIKQHLHPCVKTHFTRWHEKLEFLFFVADFRYLGEGAACVKMELVK